MEKGVEEEMEFEDILKQVGDYGRFQKRLVYFFLIPVTIIFSILCMNTFFMLSDPDHWCTVPEIQSLPVEEQHLLSRKPIPDSSKLESCSFYDIDYKSQIDKLNQYKSMNNGSISGYKINIDPSVNTITCNSWTFDKSNYDENAITYLNLVCDKKHWKSLILTIHGIGEVVGNPFFGFMADVFGRQVILFTVMICTLFSNFSPIFVKGLIAFAICRFLNSGTSASVFTLPYILVTELIGPEHRTRVIGIAACCWTLGICILPGIAYLTRDWVIMTVVPSLTVLPLFLMWKIVPESPRWLLSKGRYDDAYKIMSTIAKVNGKEVPEELMQQLVALNRKKERRSASLTSSISKKSSSKDSAKASVTSGNFLDLFKYPWLRTKFLIMVFSWTANVCAYRGLALNFENFHGNEFVNWFLLSVVEFPSNLGSWALMETRLGRRWTNAGSMLIGGISLCIPVFMPSSSESLIIYVSLVGKFLTNMAYNVAYQQTVELSPTPIRNQVMSYTTAFAAGANFALPYLAALGKIHVWIPLLVMGLICIASGIANCFLPETLHQNLPQTFVDGEAFGKNMTFFALAKKKPHVSSDHPTTTPAIVVVDAGTGDASSATLLHEKGISNGTSDAPPGETVSSSL